MPVSDRRLVRLALALSASALLAACGDATSPLRPRAAALAKHATSPTKYTFAGVTLVDAGGAPVYEDAAIQASSKRVDHGSGTTVCGYFAADGAYLGQYEAPEFVGGADIEQYCVDHFPDRQIP